MTEARKIRQRFRFTVIQLQPSIGIPIAAHDKGRKPCSDRS